MAETIPPKFGLTLFDQRILRNWSQQDVADAMTAVSGRQWHASTISRLESGNRRPPPETVLALAEAFELAGEARFAFYAAAGMLEHPLSTDQAARVWAAIDDEVAA